MPIVCLALELSEGTVTAFVEDRGQAEGRKDAENLTQPCYFVNDTLLKCHLDFFLGELVKSLIYFLMNP